MFSIFEVMFGKFKAAKSVTSDYQGTGSLIKSKTGKIIHLHPDTAPYHLSPIQFCEQKLHLSRYLDLPPKNVVKTEDIVNPPD
jgi:hypothetical protein